MTDRWLKTWNYLLKKPCWSSLFRNNEKFKNRKVKFDKNGENTPKTVQKEAFEWQFDAIQDSGKPTDDKTRLRNRNCRLFAKQNCEEE